MLKATIAICPGGKGFLGEIRKTPRLTIHPAFSTIHDKLTFAPQTIALSLSHQVNGCGSRLMYV